MANENLAVITTIMNAGVDVNAPSWKGGNVLFCAALRLRHKINASRDVGSRVYFVSDNRSQHSIPIPAIGLDA